MWPVSDLPTVWEAPMAQRVSKMLARPPMLIPDGSRGREGGCYSPRSAVSKFRHSTQGSNKSCERAYDRPGAEFTSTGVFSALVEDWRDARASSAAKGRQTQVRSEKGLRYSTGAFDPWAEQAGEESLRASERERERIENGLDLCPGVIACVPAVV